MRYHAWIVLFFFSTTNTNEGCRSLSLLHTLDSRVLKGWMRGFEILRRAVSDITFFQTCVFPWARCRFERNFSTCPYVSRQNNLHFTVLCTPTICVSTYGRSVTIPIKMPKLRCTYSASNGVQYIARTSGNTRAFRIWIMCLLHGKETSSEGATALRCLFHYVCGNSNCRSWNVHFQLC